MKWPFFLFSLLFCGAVALGQPCAESPSATLKVDAEFDTRLQGLLHGQGLRGEPVPLTYQTVVSLALAHNLELRSEQLEVPIANAQLHQAEAARNPTLYNNFFYLHQDRNLVQQNLPNAKFVLLAAGYTLTQSTLYPLGQNQMLNRTTLYVPIYTGGRLESNMHLQAALVEASKFGNERARQRLVFEAKQQYLNTLLALEYVTVADKVVTKSREILQYAESRLKAGVGTRLDVLQAQVAVSTAEDAQLKTRSNLQKAKADLAALLDAPLLTEFQIQDHLRDDQILQDEPKPNGDLKMLAEQALGCRPELFKLRQQLVANRERENVARSESLPQLGLNLNYDIIGNPARLGAGPSLAATLSIPIFDGGVSNAKVEEFHVRELQLKNDELKLIQDITLEIHTAEVGVEEADSRLETALSAQKEASEALRIASLRYLVGAGTSLEMVTAETVLANAEFALADAHFRQLVARATVNYALGVAAPADPQT